MLTEALQILSEKYYDAPLRPGATVSDHSDAFRKVSRFVFQRVFRNVSNVVFRIVSRGILHCISLPGIHNDMAR